MAQVPFHLVISKVDELLYEDEATSVNLPGMEGEFTVLAHHEPLISLLKKGVIKVEKNEVQKKFEIKGGLCEVHKNQVTILV